MLKTFSDYLGRIADLVEAGKLPETAIPRLVFSGHHLVCSMNPKTHSYKCVSCEHEWDSDTEPENCPSCAMTDLFDITDSSIAKWRCKSCSHEWIGVDGQTCPSCKEFRN